MVPLKMTSLLILASAVVMVSGASKVLLMLMDGVRWDYPQKWSTPAFDTMAAKGTKAPYINSTFISKTLPSHYSIATGLYEESHGVIANYMYDPTTNETFSPRSKETRWWEGGEPLWITARKRGLKSAVYYWAGSETELQGLHANIYTEYSKTVPYNTRVDIMMDWFVNQSIDLAMMYFNEPDSTGHKFGPESQEVMEKVIELDNMLAYLDRKLDEYGLWKDVNVMVTSDHGMAEIDHINRSVDLSQYLDFEAIAEMPDEGPVCAIFPVPGKRDEIIANLTGVQHIQVYKKEDIPERWHYRSNPRIAPLLLVADEGWLIVKRPPGYDTGHASHGWDPALMSMKPIFYARGPNIRTNYTTTPFSTVDIYPLVCRLLGIEPAPNNGSRSNTDSFVLGTEISMSSHSIASLQLTFVSCVTVLTVVNMVKIW